MDKKLVIRYTVLATLFLLPVMFLLMLLPAKHNYNALDIVNEHVTDLNKFESELPDQNILLNEHITVLGFFGHHPMNKAITASNLKELIYDKFKGFKKFQLVIVLPKGTQGEVELLKKEIHSYEDLKYWHFVFGTDHAIKEVFNSLKSKSPLDENLATDNVFIVDKDLNQRGRIDDRAENEIAKNKPEYGLNSYNAVKVAEIKNKMSEDVRVLFTEYRDKRKGNFDSATRRANDLKANHEQEN